MSAENSIPKNPSQIIFGMLKEEKIGFFKKKQVRFTFRNLKNDKELGIHSIRAKSLKCADAPLSWWTKRSWVKINTEDEIGEKHAILLNISSIATRTGLTENQIKEAANAVNAAQAAASSIVKVGISETTTFPKKVKAFDEFLKESVVNLAEGIKKELSIKTIKKTFTCDREGNIKDKDLIKEFNLTDKEHISKLETAKKFQLGNIIKGHDGQFSCEVQLKTGPSDKKDLTFSHK